MSAVGSSNRLARFALLGVAAIIAVGVGLYALAARHDAAAMVAEEAIVETGVAARIADFENQAALASSAAFDSAGAAAAQVRLMMDIPDGCAGPIAPVAAHTLRTADGVPASGMTAGEFSAVAVRLAQEVCGRAHAPRTLAQRSSVDWLGGELHLVTATLTPDGRISAVAFLFDEHFVDDFGRRYGLADIHVHPGDASAERGQAHAVIRDDAGVIIATVDWMPAARNAAFAAEIGPFVLAALALLLALALHASWRSWRQTLSVVESEQRALQAALRDVTTGLPNRAHMDAHLTALLGESGARLHLVGLDRFKVINETFGADIGDEVLRVVAARLTALAGPGVFVARMGGDEFALACRDRPDADLCNAILAAFVEPISTRIGARIVGSSIGLASAPRGADGVELVRRADLALLRAKLDGRGVARTYDRGLDDRLRARERMREDLRLAIECGQLTMAYQPQVSMTGEVVGVEALVRWEHPMDGPISPSTFVTLAEETGLSDALNAFTMRQAIHDSRRWPHLKTAVNVSPIQIEDPHFVDRLASYLEAEGVAASQIEIEITEGLLLASTPHVLDALQRLHGLGVSLALDDFGAGYSSLGYLLRFPFDKVKIDRAFVVQLGEDERADALFAAIVAMARGIGLRVIAEGVETLDQWLRLTASGCPQVQGYAVSPALAAEAMDRFLIQWPHRAAALTPHLRGRTGPRAASVA